MLTAVTHTLHQQHLISPGETVIAAVSGGADSLALLHLLTRLRERLDFHLHAATLDHGLRGSESAQDRQFVEDTCADWGIPVTADRITLDPRFSGVEAAAREARYRFLARVAREQRAASIATGHHADDQAETILMHVLRGTGLAGLRGMAYRNQLESFGLPCPLIRPLLDQPRAAIDAYCTEHGLQPRIDATNTDLAYARNAIRLTLLPALQRFNPRIVEALGRLGTSAQVDEAFIEQMLEPIWAQSQRQDDRVALAREQFRSLHPALQRRWIQRAVDALQRPAERTLSTERLLEALRIAQAGTVGARIEFPGAIELVVDYQTITVRQKNPTKLAVTGVGAQVLTIPTQIHLPNGQTLMLHDQPLALPLKAVLFVPPGASLLLRTRQPGDRFTPPGMGGHTTRLSEWMVDRRIPRDQRDTIPLLFVEDVLALIAWGDPWTIAEPFRQAARGQRVFTYLTLP